MFCGGNGCSSSLARVSCFKSFTLNNLYVLQDEATLLPEVIPLGGKEYENGDDLTAFENVRKKIKSNDVIYVMFYSYDVIYLIFNSSFSLSDKEALSVSVF